MSLLTIERSNSSDSLDKISGGNTDDEDEIDADLFHEDDFYARSRTSSFEGFFASKGAAYAIPDGDFARKATLTGGELQSHLQGMVNLIRDEDAMRLVVKVESQARYTRYLSIITTYGVSDEEESILLGFDWVDENVTIGLVIPLWSNVSIDLDGDGGFKILTDHSIYIFKPVSVQTMWTALQWIHRCLATARRGKQFSGGLSHAWLGYYENRILSSDECLHYWKYSDDIVLKREEIEGSFEKVKTDEELLRGLIRHKLKEILKRFDLDEVTCREVRDVLESEMKMSLRHLRGYIDEQMLIVVGQMDYASKITDTIFLGSEWNASNLEELKENGVGYILNVTKEVDNFFPGTFEYMNIRLHDVEEADLLRHWGKTNRFLHKAKEKGSVALVHCRRGISRSASTVVAFLMKEHKMSLHDAMKLVKTKRSIVQPNPGFWKQLIIYEGILRSSEHRHSSLFRRRSNSDSNIRRSYKKMRRKKSVEKSLETENIDGPAHAHTLPRMGHVDDVTLHENEFTHVTESVETSDSPETSDESASVSDEEAPQDRQTLRRTLSEPVMKTVEPVSPVLRKPRARTFVERSTGSEEETLLGGVTSPAKIPSILEDGQDGCISLDELKKENDEKSGGSEEYRTASLGAHLEDVAPQVGDEEGHVMILNVEDNTVNTIEEPVAEDVPIQPDLFTAAHKPTDVVEMKQGEIGITVDSSRSPRDIGSKLEDKLLAKHGKFEHCEILKKGRGRVRRRERKSKSDLQLSESGFVKRHTQIIEEHMLYSLMKDSENTLASLATNGENDDLLSGNDWSAEKFFLDCSEKNVEETSEKNSEKNNEKNSDKNVEEDSGGDVEESPEKKNSCEGTSGEITAKSLSNDVSVTCENEKNTLLGNQGGINHLVQVVNAEAREEMKNQLEVSQQPLCSSDDVNDDVTEDVHDDVTDVMNDDVNDDVTDDVRSDRMTWIDLTSHHGNVVKRKSAAFENLSEEQAKTENQTKPLVGTGSSEPITRPSEELGTSSVTDECVPDIEAVGSLGIETSDVADERIPDVQTVETCGPGTSVPKLDLVGLEDSEQPETSCTIIVEDYREWEVASVRDRTNILENIIAKTGGSFPSPRSKKMTKIVIIDEELDEEVAQLFSNIIHLEDCTREEYRPTSCPVELDEFIEVKSLVDKFEGHS